MDTWFSSPWDHRFTQPKKDPGFFTVPLSNGLAETGVLTGMIILHGPMTMTLRWKMFSQKNVGPKENRAVGYGLKRKGMSVMSRFYSFTIFIRGHSLVDSGGVI